ncbi:GNAT family N-acetyltransferase [Rhodoblastus acidophilus]|nr:GNAT family N-acetyltransferase [Rhodoblastus acidophilus]RAI22498.1 GNAT family N-acetyltransferase [Rhodoblastus acidophilus]
MKHLTDPHWLPASFLNGPASSAPNALARAVDESRPDFVHFLECLSAEAAQTYEDQWRDLANRALEPNIFFEPGFALNAARHLPGAGQPKFLLCWEGGRVEARGRLLGLWPICIPKSAFPSIARSWRHEYGCSCAPLLDSACALVVMEQMAAWLRDNHPRLSVVEAPLLIKANPTYAVMRDAARQRNLPFNPMGQYDRAALDATLVAVGARDFVSAKKRKELQRQFRRFRELGAVAFHMTHDADDLRTQIEAFMLLEAKGWKGRKGTAFLNHPGSAAFLRAMSRTLGREGKCRIYWLSLDGRMIAGNIVLLDRRGQAYFWKTAYDEDYAALSPGVLLTMDMTDRLLNDKEVEIVDSCAIPDHPMIDHLWRVRLPVADVMLGVAPEGRFAFNGLLQREKFRRSLRERTKAALARIKAR